MSEKIRTIRGMSDRLPEELSLWQHLERILQSTLNRYGYQEIRFPVVERTELFKRSIGEVTDIVEKEMYSFPDRNGDSLTLRPEGTAGCVRAMIEAGLLRGQSHRLWYQGPMFRHERPQRGRYRQFHQFGVEAFGLEGPDIDAELIAITARIWRLLGIEAVELQLNTLGSADSRQRYRQQLVDYFRDHYPQLDKEARQRLETNPLRILDSKNQDMATLIAAAPTLEAALDRADRDHFEGLKDQLDALEIPYRINPRLVRGLDYYGRTVFEWVTDLLGAQGTICAGGRYNGLVEQIGGQPTPAVGFAIGLERLVELVRERGKGSTDTQLDGYLVLAGEVAEASGLAVAERLRDAVPGVRLQLHLGGGSLRAQFKRADRSGARFALVLGEEELEQQRVTVKDLRGELEQQHCTFDEVAALLAANGSAACN